MRVSSLRAVFDLEHLAGLSDALDLVLVVSERTSYLLHNLARDDLRDPFRYALTAPIADEYQPVHEEDGAPWDLFLDVAHQAELEILEVGKMPLYGIEAATAAEDIYVVPVSGPYVRTLGPVPEGELWEVQAWAAYDVTSILDALFFRIDGGGTSVPLFGVPSPPAGEWQMFSGRHVLGPGNVATFVYIGAQAGDTLASRIWFCKLVQ